MVKNIQRGLETFANGKKYSLVLLIPSEPLSNYAKWSLIVSAPWLDKRNQKDVILELLAIFKQNLTKEDMISLSRINLIKSNDNVVKSFNAAIRTDWSFGTLKDINFFGVQIDYAILLISQKVEDS